MPGTARTTRKQNTPPPAPETPDKSTDTEDTPEETPAADPFADLLEAATITDRDASGKHRPTVDVPDNVLQFAQKLYDNRKAATFPCDTKEKFDELKLLWQSAGDKTTPVTSATITEVKMNGKLSGLRVSFGKRRGSSGKKTRTKTTPPTATNNYMENNYGNGAASATQTTATTAEHTATP